MVAVTAAAAMPVMAQEMDRATPDPDPVAATECPGNSGNSNAGGNGNTGGGNGGNNGGGGTAPLEHVIYWYHPDHLGSTGYVTDENAKIFQHLEYFPFGETFVEEHSNQQRTPYLFTSKELDEDTGLYYFGAWYYDPRTSLWASADPILGAYLPRAGQDIAFTMPSLSNSFGTPRHVLPGFGGVFTGQNLNLYGYTHQNPVKYSDLKAFFTAIW